MVCRLVTHDEGSCWVPAELRSSIILSHWGRKVCHSHYRAFTSTMVESGNVTFSED